MDEEEYRRRSEEVARKYAEEKARREEREQDIALGQVLMTKTPLELLLLTDVALFFSFSIIIKIILRDFPPSDDNNL